MKTLTLQKEILNLSKKLIRFRTTSDQPEEQKACCDFINDYFSDSGLYCKKFLFNQKPSLMIRFNRRRKQKLMLNGHIDVVEGFNSQFIPQIKGHSLFGRGSADMKAAVSTMMVLIKKIANTDLRPQLGLMIVSDEEEGGLNGTRKLVKRGYLGDFVLTGETSKFNIETRHKGMLQVRITAYGSSSHASRPWLGRNAIEKLIRQYDSLRLAIPTATAKAKWKISINPTGFISTGPFNVTPSKAEMVLDIRTTEDFTSRNVFSIFNKLNIKYKKIIDGNMLITNRKDPQVKELKKITQDILGRRVKYVKSSGGSDTQFFSNLGFPAVNFGPIGKNLHRSNEYLDIRSIAPYYQILERFIKESVMTSSPS